jgi:hypothetical protein
MARIKESMKERSALFHKGKGQRAEAAKAAKAAKRQCAKAAKAAKAAKVPICPTYRWVAKAVTAQELENKAIAAKVQQADLDPFHLWTMTERYTPSDTPESPGVIGPYEDEDDYRLWLGLENV